MEAIVNILSSYHEKTMEENEESIAGRIPLFTEAELIIVTHFLQNSRARIPNSS